MNEERTNAAPAKALQRENQDSGAIEEIRQLLLAPEQTQIRRLEERAEDLKVNAEMVSRVLPDAAVLRSQKDDKLATALLPTVEDAIALSVRRRPEVLAGAIFPLLGSAIRKAISSTLSAMLASLNQTLENSLSPRSLKWRWESWRTGRPFSEIVLLRTLEYRVEQIFLIHRADGLLLQHVTVAAPVAPGPDLISAMLTAIRDFIHDSFRVEETEEVGILQVGDLKVWVEGGPRAVLAAVIRGEAPFDLRVKLQETIEEIHRQYARELDEFNGNAQPFDSCRDLLEECMSFRFQAKKSRSLRTVWIATGAVVIIAAALAISPLLERYRWRNYVEMLRTQPGIVVIESDSHRGKYRLVGLRDPQAKDPMTLLREAHLEPNKVEARWEPYAASYSPFVLNRARELLNPPGSVTLKTNEGVLYASGTAPQSWIDQARRQSRFVGGIERYDDALLLSEDAVSLERASRDLESEIIEFPTGQATLLQKERQQIPKIVEEIRRVLSSAERTKQLVRITVLGYADPTGSEEANQRLSEARASGVLQYLELSGLPRGSAVARPFGGEKQNARRVVMFHVERLAN